MTLATFQVEHAQDVLTVRAQGEIDLSNAGELSATVNQASNTDDPAPEHVQVDLTEISYLDSAGINALADLHRELQAAGRSLNIVVPPSQSPARRVLDLIQLDSVLPMTEPEAPRS